MDLKKMSLKDLEKLKKDIDKELHNRKLKNVKEFEFNFEYTNDPRKGKPYAAKIVLNDEGEIDRKFFNLDKSYGKKQITVFGVYKAKSG
ncbi:MAG: hypothetical protein ACOCRX_10610, partial [Candidatus Woesearchaeota archaeon]